MVALRVTDTERAAVVAFIAGAGVQIVGPAIPQWIGWALIAFAILVGLHGLVKRVRGCDNYGTSFPDLVRRVAFESQWAGKFKADKPHDQWQKTFWWEPLKKEICLHLTADNPDLRARGVLSTREKTENGPSDIPPAFWRGASFSPQHMLGNANLNAAYRGSEWYDDIRFCDQEVAAIWPRRSRRALRRSPSPFLQWYQDWREQEAEDNAQAAATLDRQVAVAHIAKGDFVGEGGSEYSNAKDREKAKLRVKAELMRERAATRRHVFGGFSDSYLAAMWDAEQRGDIYDETHRMTFMPAHKGAPHIPGSTISELQRNVAEYEYNRREHNRRQQRSRDGK